MSDRCDAQIYVQFVGCGRHMQLDNILYTGKCDAEFPARTSLNNAPGSIVFLVYRKHFVVDFLATTHNRIKKTTTNRGRILCVWLCGRGNCRDSFVTLEKKRNCKNLSIHNMQILTGTIILYYSNYLLKIYLFFLLINLFCVLRSK